MKIYRVIFSSINIDEADYTINITTFLDKDLARKFFEECVLELKKQEDELDLDDYQSEETDNSYERYLDGRAIEDSTKIWLEEDNTYDELVIDKEKSQVKKDIDYEIQ